MTVLSVYRDELGRLVKGRPAFNGKIEKKRRKAISETRKREWTDPNSAYNREEYSKKISESLKQLYRKGMTPWNKGKKGIHLSPETEFQNLPKHMHLKASRRGAIVARKRMNIRPTKPEKKFIGICAKYSFPLKYVGDGSFWVDGKNPDFVSADGQRKIVEIFGDYWHNPKEEKERVAFFRERNFDCCIIWEHDLEEEEHIISKINSFLVG